MSFKIYCEEHKANHNLTDGQAERIIYMQGAMQQDLTDNPSLPHEITTCMAELLWNSTADAAYKPQIDGLIALRVSTAVVV